MRPPRRSRQAGYSLVELLVAMGIGSVLLIAISTVFIATTNGVRTLNTKVSSVADGRIVMEAMTRTMRVAAIPPAGGQTSAVVTATDNSVSFFALLNRTGVAATTTPNPTLVAYAYNGTCITESQTPQRTASDGSVLWDQNTSTKCLARTLTAPVFTYFTDGFITAKITVPASGLTLAVRQKVKSIQISVSVKDAQSPSVKAVPLLERVTLTNVQ